MNSDCVLMPACVAEDDKKITKKGSVRVCWIAKKKKNSNRIDRYKRRRMSIGLM